MTARQVLTAAAAAAMIGTAVAGCGDDEPAGGSSAPASAPAAQQRNDQDVMFARMMIPHHRQAVEMARLAPSRAKSPELKELARRIQAAQDPEIQAMSGWLRQWGEPERGAMDHGMDHGGGGASGMMSAGAMKKLAKAKGAAFDRMFATMMIEHHRGAIDMARDERAKGAYEPARKLAGTIIDTQRAEIGKMRPLAR